MKFEEWWSGRQPIFAAVRVLKKDARMIWNAAQQAEREYCAKVCEDLDSGSDMYECATAIRERSEWSQHD